MKFRDVHLFAFTHSGATYLLNVFLELGLCVYRGGFAAFWSESGGGRFRLDPRQQVDLGVWFPRFQTQDEYRFAGDLRVSWAHAFPTPAEAADKVVVVVRDPRDLLLSHSLRVAQGKGLAGYLKCPLSPADEGLLSYYPAEEWALYNGLLTDWLAPERLCLVRFEDLKSAPGREVRRVLAFCGVDADGPQLDAAIAASAHEVVKPATERWYRLHPELQVGSWQAMRKGQVGEWKTAFAAAQLETFAGLPGAVMRQLGYEAGVGAGDEPGAPGSDAGRRATEAAVEAAAASGFPEARRLLRALARVPEEERPPAAALARLLACCGWAELLAGGGPVDARLFRALLLRSRSLRPRPLLFVAAARELLLSGDAAGAQALLGEARAGADGSLHELVEIAFAWFAAGRDRDGEAALVAAAGLGPSSAEARQVCERLLLGLRLPASRRWMRAAGHGADWWRAAADSFKNAWAMARRSPAAAVAGAWRRATERTLRSAAPGKQ